MQEEEQGVYIFCGTQTDQEDDFGTIEVEGEERDVYVIRYKDAAIVAATVPMKIYTPKKDNLLMHQKMVSNVMAQKDAVIPISFGNVFKSKGDVKVLLEKLYPQFEKLFPEISGKVELGLKVIAKQEYIGSIVKKDTNLQKMAKEVEGKNKDAAYFDRMKLGEASEKLMNNIRKDIENDIYAPLEKISTASKVNEPQSEKMLLNAAFLLDQAKEKTFDEKVNELYEKWEGKVDFKYTGPWAAYNFVNIRLNIEDSQ